MKLTFSPEQYPHITLEQVMKLRGFAHRMMFYSNIELERLREVGPFEDPSVSETNLNQEMVLYRSQVDKIKQAFKMLDQATDMMQAASRIFDDLAGEIKKREKLSEEACWKPR